LTLRFCEAPGNRVPAAEFRDRLRLSHLSNKQIESFKDWMFRTHHVQYQHPNNGRFHFGLGLKPLIEDRW